MTSHEIPYGSRAESVAHLLLFIAIMLLASKPLLLQQESFFYVSGGIGYGTCATSGERLLSPLAMAGIITVLPVLLYLALRRTLKDKIGRHLSFFIVAAAILPPSVLTSVLGWLSLRRLSPSLTYWSAAAFPLFFFCGLLFPFYACLPLLGAAKIAPMCALEIEGSLRTELLLTSTVLSSVLLLGSHLVAWLCLGFVHLRAALPRLFFPPAA